MSEERVIIKDDSDLVEIITVGRSLPPERKQVEMLEISLR